MVLFFIVVYGLLLSFYTDRSHYNIRYCWYKFLLNSDRYRDSLFLYQHLSPMKLFITIKYFHPSLNIGLEGVRNAWLLYGNQPPIQLKTVIHQGHLHYRLPVSGKRISYRSLKKGLIKKQITIHLPLQILPF